MRRLEPLKVDDLAAKGIRFDIHPMIRRSLEQTFKQLEKDLSTPDSVEEFRRTKREWAQRMMAFAENPTAVLAGHNHNVGIQNALFAVSQFVTSPEQMRTFLKIITSR